MLKRTGKVIVILLAAVGLVVIIGGVSFLASGISARPDPGRVETALATRLRPMGIPRAAKNRQNPVAATPEGFEEALQHWADHCAACHSNNGDGQTGMGRGLYPRAPDMRLPATQNLSDGTLFYIIEEGVKLTGMPAWGTGTPEGETASWNLVHFIRSLPRLTPEQIERMEGMNPKTMQQLLDEQEMRRFLEGDDPGATPPAAKPPAGHRGHGQ